MWLNVGNTGTEADYLASLKGEAGADGNDGANGLQGEPGIAGAAGTNGLDGSDGNTWLFGTAVPSAEGDNGDFYLKTDNWEVYQKAGGNWSSTGNIKGPPGVHTQPTYNNNTLYPELGGYVIAVRDGGKHGLVVAMQDQGTSDWYGANNLLSDANKHDVNGSKFMDWRMPTRRELNLMESVYTDNGNGANLNANYYWSSTDLDNDTALAQNFGFGNQFYSTKVSIIFVRAVRAF